MAEIREVYNPEFGSYEPFGYCPFCKSEQFLWQTFCSEGCCCYWNCDACNKELPY